jgi:hypothetical protein
MKDFAPNSLGLRVLTPNGYEPFAGIAYMGDKPIYRLDFGNKKHLECSASHRLVTTEGVLNSTELRPGQSVFCGNGKTTKIKAITNTGKTEPVFDLVQVKNGATYVTNGVVSHNCDFVTDDETLIAPLRLSRMDGIEPIFYTGQARWFREPLPNRTYLVALDPSLGTKRDYAAIEVFMLPEMVQIAEWQSNETDARNQVRVLMQMLLFLEAEVKDHPDHSGEVDIYWTVENNTIGEAVLMVIEDTGEERFPGTFVSEKKRKGQTRRFRKGFNTDNRKKLSACARFKSLVESDRMEILSRQLIREMKFFVRKDAGFGAKPGEHDDLTMSTLLIVRMLDVVLAWSSNIGDLREYIGDEELYENEGMPIVI